MKKSYLMIIAAAAAMSLTACVQNEDLTFEEFKNATIDFQSQGVENSTRAELSMDWFKSTTLCSFGVYGFKKANFGEQIFSNEEVTCASSADPGMWVHNTVRFWDKSVNTYNFYAYAPRTTSNMTWDTTNGFTFSNLAIFNDIDNAGADKAIAKATDIGYNNGTCGDHNNSPTVPFLFKHIFSKLSFKAKTTVESSTATIYLKEIKGAFPTGTGTWTQDAPATLSGTSSFSSYTVSSIIQENASGDVFVSGDAATCKTACSTSIFPSCSGDALTADAEDFGKTFIVIPAAASGDAENHEFAVSIKYDIVYHDGVKEEDCYAFGAIKYAPNSNDYYTITINIDPAQIEFCVDNLTDWADATNKDLKVE